ncbi:hypothetical protein [Methyloprofundus sp.]|uniref:hypothetical protein n=1 Tax=Methyloprofundus sp. TaxID=2020875 RepID=UPI003D0D535C
MNKELLLECFTQLKGKAASGIDNITKDQYAIHLDANLDNLVERLHKMAYKPQPVLTHVQSFFAQKPQQVYFHRIKK